MIAGIFIILLTFALYFGKDFLLPVLLAFFIALTFRPPIRVLAKHGVPPWLAAVGFSAAVVLGILSAGYLLTGPVATIIGDAPSYAKTFSEKLRGLRDSFDAFIAFTDKMQAAAEPAGAAPAQEVVVRQSALTSYLGDITGYSATVVANLVLTFVIAAFLMASGDLFYAKLVRVIPTLTNKKRALRIVYDVEHEVSAYLLIVAAINAGLGLAVAATFFALGMPVPYLWGLLAFALNFIPYVGSIVSMALSAFMAVVVFDSLAYAMLAPLSYAFWVGIESQFVTPLLLGRRLQLNSVAILLALAFWTWLWGIAGTVIAVPVLVTLKVFCDHLEGWSGVGEFLSEKYPEERDAEEAEAAKPAV